MTTSQANVRTPDPAHKQTLKRRGLLAGAWVGAAAFVVGKMTQVVQAAVFPVQWSNSPNSQAQQFVSSPVLLGSQTDLPSSAFGNVVLDVIGFDPGTDGLHVRSDKATAIRSTSIAGNAVLGEVPGSSNANTIAVYGQNYSTYAGPTPGAGGFAVYGLSAKGHGLVGATATAGGAAVVGATNGVAGAYAAAFYGSVIVGGNFTVVGGAKSAAVPHPDGSHRRLYCMESPESWFEDFGTGQLECGRAEIPIDPDFAALVRLEGYQVFLTEYDQHNDLCVTDRAPTGFRVQAKDATADGAFGWRVVAKRKDIAGDRLETVTIPPAPILPPVPEILTPTLPTGRHQR